MQLYYYNQKPNFGDQLNPWLWPRLLPGLFDNGPGAVFLGIGTILNELVPPEPYKVVFGSGFGYGRPTNVHDGKWSVYCVRGPRTAGALGLPRRTAVTDPAVLVRGLVPKARPRPRHRFSFMPHHLTATFGEWERATALAGMQLIDPRAPVDEVLARMRDSEVVVTEAMHGAIVADALRIPWIAVRPRLPLNTPKWFDWADSLGLAIRFHDIGSAGLSEALRVRLARARSRLKRHPAGAAPAPGTADPPGEADGAAPAGQGGPRKVILRMLNSAGARRAWWTASRQVPQCLQRRAAELMASRAAEALAAAARAEPQISSEAAIARTCEQLEARLRALKKDFGIA